MSFCPNCVSGVTHEGTPVGEIQKIGGFDTYVSKPKGDYPKDKAVLFLADVFGIQFVNNKLLVDGFARNGFQVYAPDYLDGKPVPADTLNTPDPLAVIGKWFAARDPNQTRNALHSVIGALKQQGVIAFAAVGYCFGARFVFDLAFDNIIKVAAVAHPSLLVVPADIQRLLATSKAPLLLNQAEVDPMFVPDSYKLAQDSLGGGKYAPGFETTYWPGTEHGFAVRGDLSKPEVKAAKEGAFKATVEFFIKHL